VQDRKIVVVKLEALARCFQTGDYGMSLSHANAAQTFDATLGPNDSYGGLNKATIDGEGQFANLDISKPMSVKLKFDPNQDYKSLATDPDEVDDLFLVFHYKLG